MNEKTDNELKSSALTIWANFIETGCVSMSAADVKVQRDVVRRTDKEMSALGYGLKSLTESQQQLVARLRTLAIKEQTAWIAQLPASDGNLPTARPRMSGR